MGVSHEAWQSMATQIVMVACSHCSCWPGGAETTGSRQQLASTGGGAAVYSLGLWDRGDHADMGIGRGHSYVRARVRQRCITQGLTMRETMVAAALLPWALVIAMLCLH